MEKEPKQKPEIYKQIALFSSIPFVLALGPIVGWFIGKFLDKWLHTAPYLMYLFIFLGFFGSGREVYNIIKRVSKE
ncbi:MAG: hypothetical protein RBG1_1C00001G0144 [candidate division Zixibacteria bacterium RBG-1]|nr:MAG: hypothetical protein RBG1_1C00001G0144 [candidate division Zixibacteria bacterium RBG-1]OGC85386.1 MAG: hypothetical protein A2V73_08720 [candidate division Zixibacteria bacterium RBG_19FT_COMBO_42_43]